ncbi:hypothetical protein BBJ28_00004872 [Nothophytophthora sp. Chile5]|nr:hypothetical protein BBJ28_00004872 [Nothophytophthora sp. Chile5]
MKAAPASCAIQIVQDNGEDQCANFKPLTSGQLLLATRRKSRTHGDCVETQLHDCEEDAEGECFLSKFLAASLTLLVRVSRQRKVPTPHPSCACFGFVLPHSPTSPHPLAILPASEMTRQGYLILHEKRGRPAVFYFSLEDGFLRYYPSAQRVKCVGEVRLSGCKLAVKAQKRGDGVPHSFSLETRKVFVKDRSYTLGNAVRVELSACSGDDRQEWGKALFSWQRYYWRDPQAAPEDDGAVCAEDSRLLLEQRISKHVIDKPVPSSSALSFAAAKQPLTFLRRNAHSLCRSLSTMSMTPSSLTNHTSKPESGPDPTDCVKDKVALANVACPEPVKGKGAAVTPQFLPTLLGRGNNQESH